MASIEEMKASVRGILGFAKDNISSLSSGAKRKLVEFVTLATERIAGATRGEQTPQDAPPSGNPVPPTAAIPDSARLLWELAGRAPSAFVKYVSQFPDPLLDPLLADRNRLIQVIEDLEAEMPKVAPDQEDGVPKAWLNSSNVYGFKYDPASKKLIIRYQGKNNADGPVYEYSDIPKEVFEMIKNGSIPAKTSGKNEHGEWWEGKVPSIGSSANALLKNGPFAYQKLN